MERLVPQSMRRYISSKSEEELYNLLKTTINDKSYWTNIDNSDLKEMKKPESPTYLELIGKTFDELSYSNLIAYYLRNSSKGFYKLLDESFINFKSSDSISSDPKKDEYSITREKTIKCNFPDSSSNNSKNNKSLSGRVDIYIEGKYKNKEFLILIENKIKSGIEKVRNENVTQLDLYNKFVQDKVEKNSSLFCSLVLLVPDYYASTHPEFDQSKIPDGFEVVYYSDLFDFFERNSGFFEKAPYFNDFLRCLKRQTESEGQAMYNIMKERFMHKIIQASKE